MKIEDINRKRTIIFLDEIHRFNKAQQDVLLPYVEDGRIILIGATTENPYFEVNHALLSRVRVVKLELLDEQNLIDILKVALEDKFAVWVNMNLNMMMKYYR